MNKRFRVGFSFAGEKRAFVAEVAEILAQQFGREDILYDKYHEAEFARADLAFHLPKLYGEDVDLVVGVFCQEYNAKEWTGLEWRSIYGLLKANNNSTVLLSRYDHAEPEGLYELGGFIELDDRTPVQFADLIRERLAINEGKPREFYKPIKIAIASSADQSDPNLLWPLIDDRFPLRVANHREPQQAFQRLLRPEAPYQLLRIEGDSQTGKTHLSKQFLGSVFDLPGLRCGRFDFKGSSDMDLEVNGFAEQLNVALPSQEPLVSRLAQILLMLKNDPRPTLLIFDTFEAAGDADDWVRNSLLLTMMRCPWLRLVICGQRTAGSRGEPWETRSSDLIQLGRPTPEDWWAYGKSRQPDLSLENVRWAYESTGGQSSTLAQLLGPTR
ncbi:MAG: hypothetical protein ACK5RA_15195 [Cyanobacteriota bacterium]